MLRHFSRGYNRSVVNVLSGLHWRFHSTCVTRVDHGDVAVIKFDTPNSKVNTLNDQLSVELVNTVNKVQNDSSIRAMVIMSNKTDCFLAGADITMFTKLNSEKEMYQLSRHGQSSLLKLKNSDKPVVAAIMGSCLGGGLELALCCHYRLVVDHPKTVFGFPEVKLGLLPGSSGTQNILSCCPSLNQALQAVLTGSNINVKKGKTMGIVHNSIPYIGPGVSSGSANSLMYLENNAIRCARDLVQGNLKPTKPPTPISQRVLLALLNYRFIRKQFFAQVKKSILKKTHGRYPAPLKITELFEQSITKGADFGYELEAKSFAQLGMTNESNALIGLFFAHTECKRRNAVDPKKPVKRLGVLGAGLMGAGIAQVSIESRIPTVMKDINLSNLARGEHYIQTNLDKKVQRKRLTSVESEKIFSLLDSTTDLDSLRNVDMVIEAVFEDLPLKHRVVTEVENVIPPHAIMASNTSAIPIHRIAEASKRPEQFIGMHYFSPVDKMELLEIIKMDNSSNDALLSAINVGRRQGKIIITVKDGPGFYTTRLLVPMLVEAVQLMQEGVQPDTLDKATRTFGWPVGLATLVDEVGIDVANHVATTMTEAFGDRMKGGNLQLFQAIIQGGFLGRKTGKGLFDYTNKTSGQRPLNTDVQSILEKHRIVPKARNSIEHIQKRLFSRFVNEAILCLQEGILINGPVEGDAGAVFGLGFPPHLGGPFRYLDNYGASDLVNYMEKSSALYGQHFNPCQLLLQHAKDSTKKFHPSSK